MGEQDNAQARIDGLLGVLNLSKGEAHTRVEQAELLTPRRSLTGELLAKSLPATAAELDDLIDGLGSAAWTPADACVLARSAASGARDDHHHGPGLRVDAPARARWDARKAGA